MDNMRKQVTFLRLRGLNLKAAMVLLVVMPSFLLFGYNNGSVGPITDLESFAKVRLNGSSNEVGADGQTAVPADRCSHNRRT